MKFKNIVIILLIFTSCFSCDTELEEEIFSTYSADTFYENEDQLQAQNLGIYQAFRHVVWEQDMYFLGTMPHRYATARQPGFAIHSAYNTADQQPFRFERLWNVGFSAIARANTVIKYAPLGTFNDNNPEIVKQYVAEARWMRAYTYFQLTQLFGDLPIYSEPVENADPEVLFKPRSSVQDVYNLIIEDLVYANEHLPVSWQNTPSGRVTKAGGAFLLGKVYLTSAGFPLQITANYQNAINVLKPLADNPGDYNVELLSDWKSIFSMQNEGNKEIIFAHGNVYQNLLGSVLPFWTNPQFSEFGGIQSNQGSSYQVAWHPDMLDLYEPNDVRLADGFTYSYVRINNGNTTNYNALPLNVNINIYGGRNGICGTKYQDGGATGNVIHSKDHIVYRYVDVFLMLAEAYNENNQQAEALTYLDIARKRVNASTILTTDPTQLRTIIREERTRELYSEMGELFDIRRWNTTEEEYNAHLLRLWRFPNQSWDERFKLSPIPFVELGKNPNLTQNPGW
ncbi:RagB/SusD family nutrient uptake outer membrane protein [uncultured Winogradskyella sp.]|uniref:RagB/SusD family nutrient uptake outer membrane protein n=1 Tax=uncultured Winogradskyella sp. TaxID=395353 RepID=UPI0030DBC337|tara:strand:+ start:104462 stop:105994 length:1533 start_codon:yes stop_codon:yes gene_type:complete